MPLKSSFNFKCQQRPDFQSHKNNCLEYLSLDDFFHYIDTPKYKQFVEKQTVGIDFQYQLKKENLCKNSYPFFSKFIILHKWLSDIYSEISDVYY